MAAFPNGKLMNEDSLLLEPPENFLFSGKIEEDADGTLHVRRDLRLSTVSYYLLGFSPFVLSGASFLLGIVLDVTRTASFSQSVSFLRYGYALEHPTHDITRTGAG